MRNKLAVILTLFVSAFLVGCKEDTSKLKVENAKVENAFSKIN